MRGLSTVPRYAATEIRGRRLQARDIIVPPPKFGDVCRLLWPHKTAAELASIAKRDERTAKRWLSGEFEPPICVVIAVFAKMFERQD